MPMRLISVSTERRMGCSSLSPEQGLDILKPDGWHELTVADGAPSGVIVGALTDTTGQLWFRVLGRGLVRWVALWSLGYCRKVRRAFSWLCVEDSAVERWQSFGFQQTAASTSSREMARHSMYRIPIRERSYALAADPAGGIWAGWRNKGLREIDPSSGVTTTLPMPPVETIVPDLGHGTWIGDRSRFIQDAGRRPRAVPSPTRGPV